MKCITNDILSRFLHDCLIISVTLQIFIVCSFSVTLFHRMTTLLICTTLFSSFDFILDSMVFIVLEDRKDCKKALILYRPTHFCN